MRPPEDDDPTLERDQDLATIIPLRHQAGEAGDPGASFDEPESQDALDAPGGHAPRLDHSVWAVPEQLHRRRPPDAPRALADAALERGTPARRARRWAGGLALALGALAAVALVFTVVGTDPHSHVSAPRSAASALSSGIPLTGGARIAASKEVSRQQVSRQPRNFRAHHAHSRLAVHAGARALGGAAPSTATRSSTSIAGNRGISKAPPSSLSDTPGSSARGAQEEFRAGTVGKIPSSIEQSAGPRYGLRLHALSRPLGPTPCGLTGHATLRALAGAGGLWCAAVGAPGQARGRAGERRTIDRDSPSRAPAQRPPKGSPRRGLVKARIAPAESFDLMPSRRAPHYVADLVARPGERVPTFDI